MAETTAASVFSSAGGGGKQSSSPSGGSAAGGAAVGAGIGYVFGGPIGAGVGGAMGAKSGSGESGGFAGGASGVGGKADRFRLDEDPFVKAAREAKAIQDAALEKAAGLQSTTEESGTQTTSGTTSGTSQTSFDPRSKEEQALLNSSMASYAGQQKLVNDQEAGIQARSGVQNQARDSLGNIMSGEAFDLSAGEQGRIDRLRQSNIDVGSNAVNSMLTERLGEVSADAARRGLRGQAFTQLQGDAMGEAAKSLERTTLDANRLASEQAISMPGQRVGIQAGTAGQFAGFADELQQQAIQNKQALQDPIALQALRDERLKGGKTSTSGTTGGTTATTGKSTKTGLGQEEILAGSTQIPGDAGAKTGAAGTIFGGIMGASG